MKINLFLLFFCSCQTSKVQYKEQYSTQIRVIQKSIFDFKNNKEAHSYILNRKLVLQKIFEGFIDPYYGYKELNQCTNQLSLNNQVQRNDNQEVIFLDVISTDDKSIKFINCSDVSNFFKIRIEFIRCENKVYEIKILKNNNDAFAKLNYFSCDNIPN